MATTTPTQLPMQGLQAGFRRFTVAEYHEIIRAGILTEDDNLELIEGYLVHKMSRNPPHDSTLYRLNMLLVRLLPDGWLSRIQMAITLTDSEPEPDVAVVRGTDRSFDARHPGPSDFGIVIEVADATLASDRLDKTRMYAKAAIPEYWIVNLIDRQVEVYASPSGPGVTPAYAARTNYAVGTSVPLFLDGKQLGQLHVADLLP